MVYFHSKDDSSVYFAGLKQLLTEAMENTQGTGKAHPGLQGARGTGCFIPALFLLHPLYPGLSWEHFGSSPRYQPCHRTLPNCSSRIRLLFHLLRHLQENTGGKCQVLP